MRGYPIQILTYNLVCKCNIQHFKLVIPFAACRSLVMYTHATSVLFPGNRMLASVHFLYIGIAGNPFAGNQMPATVYIYT